MKISRSMVNLNNINKLRLLVDDMGYTVSSDADWCIERNPPMTSRLFYVIGGDPFIEADGKIINLEAGKCYLIPSGCAFKASTKSSLDMLYFHLRIVDYSGMDALKRCNGIMSYTPSHEVFDTMKKHIIDDSLTSSLALRREILNTLLEMFEANAFELETHVYSPEVLKAIEYINSRLSIQLDVDEIAANSLVSVSTLTKKFKQEVGTTVSAYIDSAIMIEAAKLLNYSNLTIQQISTRFEFCYQSYFTRRFKLWYGLTPQQYRAKR